MGNTPSVVLVASFIVFIFAVAATFFYLTVIGVIKSNGSASAGNVGSGATAVGLANLKVVGNSSQGVIYFTTDSNVPQGGVVQLQVNFGTTKNNYEVVVIGLKAGGFNAVNLLYNVSATTSTYFVVENGFPLQPNTSYSASYTVINT